MKKFLLVIAVIFCFAGSAPGASKEELQRLSTFMSSFTEAGLFNFDIRSEFDEGENYRADGNNLHLGMPENADELIRFGIVNNLNHNNTRIKKCRDPRCESGALTIEKRFVADTVRRFFGLLLTDKDFDSISDNPSVAFAYDGELFHFDADSFKEPGLNTVYYAEVLDVDVGRYISLAGEIYNSQRPSLRPGTFSAFVRRGGGGWQIISMSTRWKERTR